MTTSDPITAALQRAVDDGTFPGAVLAVRLRGVVVYEGAVGRLSPDGPRSLVTPQTCYDLASLTKVLATTTAMALLIQEGRTALDERIDSVLEELRSSVIGAAPLRRLLTHSSGLPGWRPFYERIATADERRPDLLGSAEARRLVMEAIAHESLVYEPGSRSLYSDLGFMLLGCAVERLAGEPLDRFCATRIFEPLHAHPLTYVPRRPLALHAVPPESTLHIAPTEQDPWRDRLLLGEVHDENAFALSGVAGHAGLFGTAAAVLAVAGAWMDARRGKTGLIAPASAEEFTRRQNNVPHSSWALGWDMPSAPSSAGTCLSPESFGHLGYTGTSLWIDPVQELEVVLLSNRVHPTRRNERIRAFRPMIHDVVYREVVGS